jgi:hypothetical protein
LPRAFEILLCITLKAHSEINTERKRKSMSNETAKCNDQPASERSCPDPAGSVSDEERAGHLSNVSFNFISINKKIMDKRQQRIAIAEACNKLRWTLLDNKRYPDCPDYLNDLNDMHEAEKTLNKEQRKEYDVMIISICACEKGYSISATAAQRAEAFLRTLDLWED